MSLPSFYSTNFIYSSYHATTDEKSLHQNPNDNPLTYGLAIKGPNKDVCWLDAPDTEMEVLFDMHILMPIIPNAELSDAKVTYYSLQVKEKLSADGHILCRI